MEPSVKNGGFTLIEMLVATAISSIILVMVYTAYASIIRSVKQAQTASAYFTDINLVIKRMDTDLSNVYWNEKTKDINFIASVEGGSGNLNFVTAEYKGGRIINSVKENSPSSDIHEVGYYLEKNNSGNGFNLIRRSEIHYDSAPLIGGIEEVILKNVESLKFSFKYRSDWTDSWDTREKKRLPSGIRTTLVTRDFSGKSETFTFFSICNMSHD